VATRFSLPEGVDDGAIAAAHMLVIPPPDKTLKKLIQIIDLVAYENENLKLPTKCPLSNVKLGSLNLKFF
jgi:hypothetical protein